MPRSTSSQLTDISPGNFDPTRPHSITCSCRWLAIARLSVRSCHLDRKTRPPKLFHLSPENPRAPPPKQLRGNKNQQERNRAAGKKNRFEIARGVSVKSSRRRAASECAHIMGGESQEAHHERWSRARARGQLVTSCRSNASMNEIRARARASADPGSAL